MSMHGQQVSNYPAAKSTRHASWLKSTCLHSTWVTCAQGFHFHSAFSLSTASTHKHPSYCTHQSILHAWESFCPFLFAVFVSPYQAVAQLLHVSGVTGCFSGQDTSMHCRMQGLHSAAQHLWMSSQFRHIPDTKQRLWELREGLTCCRYLQYCSSTCGRLRLWL